MPLNSMTGFAREAAVTGPTQWAWEIKTVNGRGLDIRVRVPQGFDAVGDAARQAVAATLSRGQCQLTLNLTRQPGAPRIRVNREVLDGLIASLADIRRPEGLGPATLDGLLAVRGVVEIEEDGQDGAFDETLKTDLLGGIGRLTVSLVAARAREGAALSDILGSQIDLMDRLVAAADACPARRPEAIRTRLETQIRALLDNAAAFDQARLHQEAALIATRADIREELDWLRAHMAAARELVAEGGPVGRRLDFLAQEFGREANTLCAKANDVELSRIGLELKAVIEQFREQVQNVE